MTSIQVKTGWKRNLTVKEILNIGTQVKCVFLKDDNSLGYFIPYIRGSWKGLIIFTDGTFTNQENNVSGTYFTERMKWMTCEEYSKNLIKTIEKVGNE